MSRTSSANLGALVVTAGTEQETLVCRALERSGIDFRTVRDSAGAERLLNDGQYDLLIVSPHLEKTEMERLLGLVGRLGLLIWPSTLDSPTAEGTSERFLQLVAASLSARRPEAHSENSELLAFRSKVIAQLHSHFLSNLVHDVRSLIVAIRGYTRMVLEGRAGDLRPGQSGYLEVVARNAESLIHLTDAINRISSEAEVEPSAIDLDQAVRESIERLTERKRVQITSTAGREKLAGDPNMIREAVSTLLVAAFTLGEPNHPVGVEIKPEQGKQVVLRISTRAVHLPADNLDVLFKPGKEGEVQSLFPSLPSSLDLARARNILWKHGCRVSATREEGDLLSVIVRFPIVV
jgi:signal transduction histidine kinase